MQDRWRTCLRGGSKPVVRNFEDGMLGYQNVTNGVTVHTVLHAIG